jgi:hypothetical protein
MNTAMNTAGNGEDRMTVEAEGVVESITNAGYVDHYDDGVAVFDTMILDIQGQRLRVILDGLDRAMWTVGLRVRFEIDEEYLGTVDPVFEGTLEHVEIVP